MMEKLLRPLLAAATLSLAFGAHAGEAQIRKALGERIPEFAQIDEVSATPMKGLFEIRIGSDLFYSDANGRFLIQGELIDTQVRRNLTEDRLRQLTTVAYKDLPLKDAITIVRGSGARQLAVFADPNCGYCKRFEKDLQSVNNVTVHLFLIPFLSPDSAEKSRNIWCAKEPITAWDDWMLRDKLPASAQCDATALQRNLAFARKYKINGTPTLFFADNDRIASALGAQEVEERLTKASARK